MPNPYDNIPPQLKRRPNWVAWGIGNAPRYGAPDGLADVLIKDLSFTNFPTYTLYDDGGRLVVFFPPTDFSPAPGDENGDILLMLTDGVRHGECRIYIDGLPVKSLAHR
jgi:hypothetical protein